MTTTNGVIIHNNIGWPPPTSTSTTQAKITTHSHYSIIMKFMSINHTKKHDDEERRSLLNVTKNANATINVRLSTVAILVGCGFLLGSLSGPLSGSGSSIGKTLLETVALKDDLVEVRDVHINSQCRCPSDFVPVPIMDQEQAAFEPRIIQPPSKATGSYHKRFIHHPINHVVVIKAFTLRQKDCNQSELRITSCQR